MGAGDQLSMYEVRTKFDWRGTRGFAVVLVLEWVLLVGGSSAKAGAAAQQPESTTRLLTAEEGRSIVNAALEGEQPVRRTADCSHFVHQIYLNAGFEYPYASSFEIYAGNENFAHVRFPRAGDLIVWPGHVGIIVDPLQHSFYSLVSTGVQEQDYEGPYWKSRGKPRFYRYRVENGDVLSATKTLASPHISNAKRPHFVGPVVEEQSPAEGSALNQPPKAASERTAIVYGPAAAPEISEAATAFEMPSSIIIAAGSKLPTRGEVAEGVSELSDAAGNVLRTDDPLRVQLPVVIVEQFSVERVDIRGDHGWARLQIDSKVSIGGGAAQVKGRQEKVRWELRRRPSGWEAVAPSDRSFVPHDVAVKNLATQLARLAQSDGAAARQETVLRHESQLANLLSALLEYK
jgi:NlpC/P60 family